MAESVVVGVRVRPYNEREKNLNATCCIEMNGGKTIITDSHGTPKDFTFDESFWSHDGFEDRGDGYMVAAGGSNYADQRAVFEVFGQRVLDNAWDGFHCCLFAYGQTGSGKSYSMVGYGKNTGIVPISCEEIFLRIDKNPNPDIKFEVAVSMIEIYNEAVQDLLIPIEDRPKKGLEIRESKHLGIYIDGVTRRPVDCYESIEETIQEATEHRTVGATLMNATSSRAHTVQCIEFKQIATVAGKDQIKLSMVNLVDLAGSEKAGQTGATGDRLKEGAAINKSLSALGNVIEKLAEKSNAKAGKNIIVPYRDSKLTRLLQNALGGSSKTIMICALSPASSNYEETLSTLRYADRAKKIKNVVKCNEDPAAKLMRELKEENDKLKLMVEKMQSGQICSSQELTEMAEGQKEASVLEAELKYLTQNFEERLKEAAEKQAEQHAREHKRGSVIRCTVKNVHPVLVNLNSDPQLTGKIKYVLVDGVPTRVGRKPAHTHHLNAAGDSSSDDSSEDEGEQEKELPPQVMLMDSSVCEKHATITNANGECSLLCALGGIASAATFINGVSVTELLDRQDEPEMVEKVVDGSILLTHGDRVLFGQCSFFFCHPQRGIPEVMILSGQVEYQMSLVEVHTNHKRGKNDKYIQSTMRALGSVLAFQEGSLRGELDMAMTSIDEGGDLEAKNEEIAALQADLKLAKEQAEETAAYCQELKAAKDQAAAEVKAAQEQAAAQVEQIMEKAESLQTELEAAKEQVGKAEALQAELKSTKEKLIELEASQEQVGKTEALQAELKSAKEEAEQAEAQFKEVNLCMARLVTSHAVNLQQQKATLKEELELQQTEATEAMSKDMASLVARHSIAMQVQKQSAVDAQADNQEAEKLRNEVEKLTTAAKSDTQETEQLRNEVAKLFAALEAQKESAALAASNAQSDNEETEQLRREVVTLMSKQLVGKSVMSITRKSMEDAMAGPDSSPEELRGRIDKLQALLSEEAASAREADPVEEALGALKRAETSLGALASRCGNVSGNRKG